MGKLRRSLVVVLALLCATSVVPGSASATRVATSPQMRQIDRQIADAYHRIDVWNRRLGRWQVQVGKVAVHVERLTAMVAAEEGRGGEADVLRRSTPRRWFLSYRLHRAHRSLRAILDDREAA